MQLRFVTIANSESPVPAAAYRQGQRAPRVGLRWDTAANRYVSTGQPLEVPQHSRTVVTLAKMVRTGDLVPADADTAAAIGAQYRPVEYLGCDDGWAYVSTPAAVAARKKDASR